MDERRTAAELARTEADRYVAELMEIAAIPSISTLAEHAADMRRAAGWVCSRLSAIEGAVARMRGIAQPATSQTLRPTQVS
jgi:hypothetical protein